MNAAHIARAAVMSRQGHEAEARYYLRHLARSTLRYARSFQRHPVNEKMVAELQADGLEYARASRQYAGGPIHLGRDVVETYWHEVVNPHWPELTSHGVFVAVRPMRGAKRPAWHVEIQVLSPDLGRTQCCATRVFDDEAKAQEFARRWITIGHAIVDAEVPS